MAFSPSPKPAHGFAAMEPAQRSAIAAEGGRAIPAEKRSFSQDRALAVAAGRKGGMSRQSKRPAD